MVITFDVLAVRSAGSSSVKTLKLCSWQQDLWIYHADSTEAHNNDLSARAKLTHKLSVF